MTAVLVDPSLLTVYLYEDLKSFTDTTADMAPLLHLVLPHISHFPNVSALKLDGCQAYERWDEGCTELLASAFPALSHLTILQLTFKSLPHLVDLVSSFPQLTQLTADDLDILEGKPRSSRENQESYEGSKTPPPLLQSLQFASGNYASGVGPFLSWLAAGPQALNTLYLELDAEAGYVDAGVKLIEATGKNLIKLVLTHDDWQMWNKLSFSANSNLSSLTLINIGYITDIDREALGLFKSLSSSLEYLNLGPVDYIEDIWPGLVNVLVSSLFASLVQIKLCVSTESDLEELQSKISDEFPALFSNGKVVFALMQSRRWERV